MPSIDRLSVDPQGAAGLPPGDAAHEEDEDLSVDLGLFLPVGDLEGLVGERAAAGAAAVAADEVATRRELLEGSREPVEAADRGLRDGRGVVEALREGAERRNPHGGSTA